MYSSTDDVQEYRGNTGGQRRYRSTEEVHKDR